MNTTYRTLRALNIVNGDTVVLDGRARLVASVHYSGPIDGTGITTLCFEHGDQWQGSALSTFEVTP